MTTYTPSFNNPITKNIKITNSLIVSPSATGPFSIFTASNSFTSLPNSQYNWTTTVSSETLTLPLTPINGAYVIINDIEWSWGNFPPSIDYNGATSKGAVANATDLSLYAGAEIKFIYNSNSNEWTSYLKPVSTDDPFHGWWKNVAKTVLLSGVTDDQFAGIEPLPSGYTIPFPSSVATDIAYYYLDCISHYPLIKLTSYGSNYNNTFGALQFESYYERLPDGVSIAYPGVVGTNSFSAEAYLSAPINAPNTLTLQSNNTQLFGNYAYNTDPDFIFGPGNSIQFGSFSSLLQKMDTPPDIRPYNDNEVAYPDIQDPIFMFKYFAKIISEKGMVGNNSIGGQDTYYPGYYNEQAILNSYLNGKTFEYPIHHIIKSTTSQYTPETFYQLGYGSLTGATKIFLADNHLVTPGSSITISGFSGAWDVLNNEYTNDVIFDSHFNNSSSGHFDANFSTKEGTFYNSTNFFVIRNDTSSLIGISSGPFNGWASYTGTPVVSVTHHVTSDMTYNNFMAAIKAYFLEVYGSQEHSFNQTVFSEDFSGRTEQIWESSSYSIAQTAQQGFSTVAGPSRYYNLGDPLSQLLVSTVCYADHYDILNTIVNYLTGASTGGWSISALNYLDPDETYNIYYGFEGEFATGESTLEVCGQIQQYWGEIAGAMNVSITGLTGGGYLVATGAKYGGNNDVDRTKWNILGSINTLDGYESLSYNYMLYGLVKSNLTPDKKIGYIYTDSSLPFSQGIDEIWYPGESTTKYFNTWANKDILQNAPDKWANGTIAAPMVPMMKYFNAKQVDAIIIDNRCNVGGYDTWFEQFFGGDRLKNTNDYFYLNTQNQLSPILNISQFEYYQNLNLTGSDNYLHPSFLESSQGYGTGCVYHGSPSTGAKIVFLQGESSISAGQLRLYNFLGDNFDGQIGNNTSVKILGCSKGYFDGFRSSYSIPTPYIQDSIRGNPFIYTSIGMEGPVVVFKLSTGSSGSVTLNHVNQISNINAVDAMTSITGAFSNTLGNPFPMDLETRVYPDFGFVENTRPRLPGDNRPQQPDPTVSGTWRDSWLEAAIGESVYGTW